MDRWSFLQVAYTALRPALFWRKHRKCRRNKHFLIRTGDPSSIWSQSSGPISRSLFKRQILPCMILCILCNGNWTSCIKLLDAYTYQTPNWISRARLYNATGCPLTLHVVYCTYRKSHTIWFIDVMMFLSTKVESVMVFSKTSCGFNIFIIVHIWIISLNDIM